MRLQNVELELKYKSCYARILDSKRRFLEAATRYYDLSQAPSHGEPGVQVRVRVYLCAVFLNWNLPGSCHITLVGVPVCLRLWRNFGRKCCTGCNAQTCSQVGLQALLRLHAATDAD